MAAGDVQYRATDPAASAWVSANAGSGKTFVLTRRVIRLMLGGCDPGRILCLTFTKAAAAEMANRVFKELGAWAVLPDGELARRIADIDGTSPEPARVAAARRLFARALETPGGLKVRTIHAFCETLLQRFPVEADLPGRFEVLDDRRGLALKAEARARALREAAADRYGPLGAALALVLARATDGGLDGVLDAFLARRDDFLAFVQSHPDLDAAIAAMAAALGVPAGATRRSLVAAVCPPPEWEQATLHALCGACERDGAKTMRDLAENLRRCLSEKDPDACRALWRTILLTQSLEARKSHLVKSVATAFPGWSDRFAAEAERVIALERAIAACETAEMTAAAARLADRVIGHYQALKRAAGALDFDDLVQRTVALLARSDAASWVQYKLDEGLDHVLVDEAQDTSPSQWLIVKALTGDFFAGKGARGTVTRTVFAVGDEKQSIYSFQGAEPVHFADSGKAYEKLAGDVAATFHPITLNKSYRSTPDVVKAVDRVFEPADVHQGLSRDNLKPVHETNRLDDPGLVEVWPEVEVEKAPPPARWEDPVDQTGPGSPDVVLAARIADEVDRWIRNGECIEATGKPIRPGDVLILVRKRGPFVNAINRELKRRGVAVAGADRLDVLGHIVAEDLMAAARVALLPDDDLTLAAFARSPLVPPGRPGEPAGLSEEALFALAHGRDGSLWSAVRKAADAGQPDAVRLRARVDTLLARADFGDPFAFFAAIVGKDGGRAAFRSRLGREADEVIDEFLALALSAEERGAATLAGFLAFAGEAKEDVKREVDSGRNEVRVMTVHGAKGLEAPVVFLVDPGSPPVSSHHDPAVLRIGEPGAPLVWLVPGQKVKPACIEQAIAAWRLTQEHEYRRLLYVGLTRAADRLIVAGIRRANDRPDGRWHTVVRAALERDAEEVRDETGQLVRWVWRHGARRKPRPRVEEAGSAVVVGPLPDFLARPAPSSASARTLTPSAAAKALDGAEERDGGGSAQRFAGDALERVRGREAPALAKGHLIHRLFELLPDLPPEARRARAEAHMARAAANMPAAERAVILSQVLAVLDHPHWAEVFGPASRAEVAVAGELAAEDGRALAVNGQVDRLVAGPDGILIVDFKTGRIVPDTVPLAYATQLALYRALFQRLRPGVPVRAAVLWTEVCRLDEVPADHMDGLVARLLTNMGTGGPGAAA